MKKHSVAAVVVTYNRLPLLQKCIKALEAQTSLCDILVVNNDSTDGTTEWLEAQQSDSLRTRNTGANLGGAGGFNYGMRWAVEDGYEFLWVMDDDCIPKPDALEKLLEADEVLKGEYGWLSSKVLWKDGSICKMNLQRKTIATNLKGFDKPLTPAVMASFVSLFLSARIVRELGLPIKEFFIWTDDWEFTRRISRHYPCYAASNSVVVHESASNTGADIATECAERLDRFDYLYRNDVYLYRREALKGSCYEAARLGFHCLKVIIKSPDSKGKRLKKIVIGTKEGLFFSPSIEYLS